MSVAEQTRIVNYLTGRVEKTTGSLHNAYLAAIKNMVDPEGIQFANLTFDEALKKAKEGGKMLFVDCYTSWCGPCKMMSQQVFTQKYIGDFFNQRFVSIKIDMEKGEGPALQKKYGVEAYPTMLFLDEEGRVVYKILGGSDAKGFMEKVMRISPETCYYMLKEKYEAGDRSVDYMPDYFATMIDAGELDHQEAVVRNYLNLLNHGDKLNKYTWKLYKSFITDFKMPEFKFVCENRKSFVEQAGEEEVNKKIESILFPVVIGYLKNSNTREEMEEVRNLMLKAVFPEQFSLSYLNQVVALYEKKDFEKTMDYYEHAISGISDAHTKLNLDILLNSLLEKAPAIIRERAANYVKGCLEKADPKAVNSYKKLLEVLSEQE